MLKNEAGGDEKHLFFFLLGLNPLSLTFLYNHFSSFPSAIYSLLIVVRITEEFVMITALNGSVILVS